jgi:uncharacterized protein involved in exopolysaccharide biosynthesis
MNQENFTSENLFVIVWKNRKKLLIVGVLAAVVSAVVSLMMEEKFLSTATVFPAKTNSVNLSGTNLNPTQTLTTFGDEESAEQMLQILNSAEIKNKIIGEYDLFKHYRIKDNDKYRYTAMNKKYESNINFNRTKLGSVQVSVYDRSPDTAAKIANRIIQLYDEVKNRMIRERSTIIYENIKAKKIQLESELKQVIDSMNVISGSNLTTEQLQSVLSRNSAPVAANKNQMRDLAFFNSIIETIKTKNQALLELEIAYNQAEADANLNISHKFVVEDAYASEKKAKPIRWIIVVSSTFAALFMAVIVILFIERIRFLRANGSIE